MSRLPSTHHSFSVELATELGSTDLAILATHISYWIKFNERAGRNLHDGRHWMYQTQEDMLNHFPYWTNRHLRHLIDTLIKKGYLIKGNYNKTKMDKTCWYTIDLKEMFTKDKNVKSTDQVVEIGEIKEMFTKDKNVKSNDISVRSTDENVRPIPDTKTNTKEEELYREFGSFVKFTQSQYDSLCKENGKEFVDDIIERINDYCVNDRTKGYKDYTSAFRNFMKNKKSIVKSPDKKSSEQNITNNKKIAQLTSKIYESSHFRIDILTKCIEFVPLSGNTIPDQVNFDLNENAFIETIENILRKKQFHKKK